MAKTKLDEGKSANAVIDSALQRVKDFEKNTKSSFNFYCPLTEHKCRNACIWLERDVTNNCRLSTVPKSSYYDDNWGKVGQAESIMSSMLFTPLSESEKLANIYYTTAQMREISSVSVPTLRKHIRNGKLWARIARPKGLAVFVSKKEDFENYMKYGNSKGEDKNYPNDVRL